jgi:hypothetical protein
MTPHRGRACTVTLRPTPQEALTALDLDSGRGRVSPLMRAGLSRLRHVVPYPDAFVLSWVHAEWNSAFDEFQGLTASFAAGPSVLVDVTYANGGDQARRVALDSLVRRACNEPSTWPGPARIEPVCDNFGGLPLSFEAIVAAKPQGSALWVPGSLAVLHLTDRRRAMAAAVMGNLLTDVPPPGYRSVTTVGKALTTYLARSDVLEARQRLDRALEWLVGTEHSLSQEERAQILQPYVAEVVTEYFMTDDAEHDGAPSALSFHEVRMVNGQPLKTWTGRATPVDLPDTRARALTNRVLRAVEDDAFGTGTISPRAKRRLVPLDEVNDASHTELAIEPPDPPSAGPELERLRSRLRPDERALLDEALQGKSFELIVQDRGWALEDVTATWRRIMRQVLKMRNSP